MHIAQRKDRWMDVCVFGKSLGFDGSAIWNPFFLFFLPFMKPFFCFPVAL